MEKFSPDKFGVRFSQISDCWKNEEVGLLIKLVIDIIKGVKMAKENLGRIGGLLMLLGAAVYLYILFVWYGSTPGPWLSMASFLAPFVAAGAFIIALPLLFWSFGILSGNMMKGDKFMVPSTVLWVFVTLGGLLLLVITGGTGSFLWALAGFVLTYFGAAMLSM